MKIETRKINLSELKINPDNPRLIKDEKYKSLLKSLKNFPEMLELREIVVDSDYMILGGNMRYKALKELGETVAHVKIVYDATNEQKKEFIIKDNIPFGEWDWDVLANEWDTDLIEDWGVDLMFNDIEKIDIEGDNLNNDLKFMTQINHIRDQEAKRIKDNDSIDLINAMLIAETSILNKLKNEYITN